MDILKKDVDALKYDVDTLKHDIDTLKHDIDTLKIDMNTLRKEVKEDILLFKDDICKLIPNLQDDVTVVTEYKDVIEDHEIRIYDLEKYSRPN